MLWLNKTLHTIYRGFCRLHSGLDSGNDIMTSLVPKALPRPCLETCGTRETHLITVYASRPVWSGRAGAEDCKDGESTGIHQPQATAEGGSGGSQSARSAAECIGVSYTPRDIPGFLSFFLQARASPSSYWLLQTPYRRPTQRWLGGQKACCSASSRRLRDVLRN